MLPSELLDTSLSCVCVRTLAGLRVRGHRTASPWGLSYYTSVFSSMTNAHQVQCVVLA